MYQVTDQDAQDAAQERFEVVQFLLKHRAGDDDAHAGFGDDRRGHARLVVDKGHLAEDAARSHRADGNVFAVDFLDDIDTAALHDVGAAAAVSITEILFPNRKHFTVENLQSSGLNAVAAHNHVAISVREKVTKAALILP